MESRLKNNIEGSYNVHLNCRSKLVANICVLSL